MLILLVFSVLAALSFRRVARAKGYLSPRIWIYPLAVGGFITLVGVFAEAGGQVVFKGKSSALALVWPYLVSVLCFAVLGGIVGVAWKQVKALPPRE